MAKFVPNPRQREAIEHVHGPMLVVAGAGAGKTTVLVERIARLIAHWHARPDEILATTYTINAATELREKVRRRVFEVTGSACADIQACTFHAYCNELLQRTGRGFGLLDGPDLWIYLRRRLRDLRLQHYTRAVDPGEFLYALLDFFSRCHDELVDVPDYERYVDELCRGKHPLPRVLPHSQSAALTREQVLDRCREIARVYRTVEEMLGAANLGTYGHMVLRAVQLLRSDPALLAAARARARFILIDEFQDANLAQIELAQLLAGDDHNLFAVGDPDQAIYRFRGASSAAFAEFSHRFPDAAGVFLEDNQRSGEAVLRCAFAAISQNPAAGCRVGGSDFERKPLASARQKRAADKGQKLVLPTVEVVACSNDDDEACDVSHAIAALQRRPRAETRDCPCFGVLYRAHSNRDSLALALSAAHIPFSVKGINALETAAVRDLLACLRALHSPAEAESLFRVAALPLFGVDGLRVREELAACRDADFATVLQNIPGGAAVLAALQQARSRAAEAGMKIAEVVGICLATFALDAAEPGIAAFRNFVGEWAKKAFIEKGDLPEFLAYMDWFAQAPGAAVEVPLDADPADTETVRLMTVHAAKGLEFDHVFVLRLNHGSFPARYRETLFEFPAALRRSPVAGGDDPDIHKQEERRLFYVAMTRARDSLTLLARAGNGKKNPRPTAFVRELMDAESARKWWRQRAPVPPTFDIHAAAAAPPAGVGAWLLAGPSVRLASPSLSASSIEAYETCPLKFKLRRDWNIPGPVAAAVQYGNAMHRVLGDYYAAHMQGRTRALEQVLQLFRDIMVETRFDPLQREMYERQGVEQLTKFVALRLQEPPPAVLHVEQTFELKIGTVLVKGRIDRVDRIEGRRVLILDYKTGKAQDSEKAKKSLQLSLYALAAREKFNFLPERLAFYSLENQTLVETTRSDLEFEDARRRVLAVADGIAAGIFEPTPNYHCRWCEYRSLCPATEQKLYLNERAAGVN